MIYSAQGYDFSGTIPECPTNKKLIYGWDSPIEQQYWKTTYTLTDSQFYALTYEDQSEIVEIEDERCRNGFWFMNHGKPFYVTGDNYFYLNFWFVDESETNRPYFIQNQALNFYFYKYCQEDPKCFGSIELKPRQEGATQRKIATFVNRAIRIENKHFGIQSKTGDDAEQVNFGNLKKGFAKLPHWMKPKTKADNVASEIAFEQPPKRYSVKESGRPTFDSEYYLNTKIDWRTTVAKAYDGSHLYMYIMDEFAKWDRADAYLAWTTHKRCLGDKFRLWGKAFLLSTIGTDEKEEKVSEEAIANGIKLWRESSHLEKNSLGYTDTGLYRWFIPASSSKFGTSPKTGKPLLDKYGNIDENEIVQIILEDRANEKDPAKKLMLMRLDPLNAQEALTSMINSDSSFKHIQFRLQDRLDYLDSYISTDVRPAKYWTGNLAWEGGERFTKVVRVDSDTPRFVIPYLPSFFGEGNTNRVKTMSNGGFTFFSDSPFVMGVDPFNYAKTVSGEGSRGAFHIKHKYQNRYCLHYLFRPASPELFFEDVLMAAWYFGARINPERSGSNIFNWFRDNGCYNMIMFRPDITKNSSFTKQDTEKGTTPSPENVELGCNLIESYFALPKEEENENTTDYLEMFWHEETLKQLMGFDKAKREKYDLVMAMIYTEIACQSLKKPRQQQSEITKGKLTFVDYLMPVYDRSGGKISVSTHYELNQREARRQNTNQIINPPND